MTDATPLDCKTFQIVSIRVEKVRYGFLRFRHEYRERERTHTVCKECLEDFWEWYKSKGARLND